MSIDAPILIYKGHSDNVFAVAWSPDGSFIASGSRDKTVRVWKASTGEDRYIYHGHSLFLLSLAWSPTGKYIASGDTAGVIHVWDAFMGALLLPTAVILALCAASHGLPAAHISPLAGIMAIVQYRFGRLFVESMYIPTAVNIESLPLPGPL